MFLALAIVCLLITYVEAFTRFSRRPTTLSMSLAQQSVDLYTEKYAPQMNNPDSRFMVTERTLKENFVSLSSVVGGEDSAAEICQVWPDILRVDPTKVAKNMETYVACFEFDEAVGMVKRNPNLFAVATEGYGSAEASCAKGGGKDMMSMSYVIAYTRPIGKPLLGLLALCLAKAVIFGPGMPTL